MNARDDERVGVQPFSEASGDRWSNDLLSSGRCNRALGWTMLVGGIALAAVLDPWFFSAVTAADFANGNRPAVRHAQGVVLGMALLQLAMAHLLATLSFSRDASAKAAILTSAGAVVYSTGYAAGLWWPGCLALVLLGSSINFSGFAFLLWRGPSGEFAPQIRLILPVACFGMALDFLAGVFQVLPNDFVSSYLGPDDAVPLRMMRLARVAAIALSVLTLLYYGVAQRAGLDRVWARRGGWLLASGAIGMPTILAASCFLSLHLKYLLSFPASTVTAGVVIGLLFSLRHAHFLERWGWALIVGSTSVGMIIGMYAFDGPLPTPELLGEYNELPRRLSRLAHSYCIVFGLLSILLAREIEEVQGHSRPLGLGASLFLAGSVITVCVLVLQIGVAIPAYSFRIGPALATAGAVTCLCARLSESKQSIKLH